MTPTDLARASGLAVSTVQRILKREMMPALESIVAISVALKRRPAQLLENGAVDAEESVVRRSVDLPEDVVAAIREEIRAAMSSPDDLMVDVAKKVPRDILEALVSQDHDWNFVRAQFDLPIPKSKSKSNRSS